MKRRWEAAGRSRGRCAGPRLCRSRASGRAGRQCAGRVTDLGRCTGLEGLGQSERAEAKRSWERPGARGARAPAAAAPLSGLGVCWEAARCPSCPTRGGAQDQSIWVNLHTAAARATPLSDVPVRSWEPLPCSLSRAFLTCCTPHATSAGYIRRRTQVPWQAHRDPGAVPGLQGTRYRVRFVSMPARFVRHPTHFVYRHRDFRAVRRPRSPQARTAWVASRAWRMRSARLLRMAPRLCRGWVRPGPLTADPRFRAITLRSGS